MVVVVCVWGGRGGGARTNNPHSQLVGWKPLCHCLVTKPSCTPTSLELLHDVIVRADLGHKQRYHQMEQKH